MHHVIKNFLQINPTSNDFIRFALWQTDKIRLIGNTQRDLSGASMGKITALWYKYSRRTQEKKSRPQAISRWVQIYFLGK